MRTIAVLSLLLAGCGAASPCQPATAAGEPYCAMVCAPNPERASHGCPGELSYRTNIRTDEITFLSTCEGTASLEPTVGGPRDVELDFLEQPRPAPR